MRKLLSGLFIAVCAMPALAAPPQGWTGTWRNGSNSVHIRAQPCGRGPDAGMCGTVIWASAKAKADVAARGRTLIGQQLFRGFQPAGDGVWEGEVYIPDIDRTFAGTITLDGPNRLVGEGCLFGGFGCKTQTWTRVRK